MCLVEVKGGRRSRMASCAMAVRDLRPGPNGEPPEMFTKSPMVKKAREGVMEFLLINHPLDCPICDQGGECDLQDQAMAYGVDGSRFDENKRAVEDKYIGPLVKTSMTRCIHCTRCVRFTTEVAGVAELGAIGRGEDMEITTYLEKAHDVGAAGQRHRPLPGRRADLEALRVPRRGRGNWSRPRSIDVMDAVGSAIRVDTRGREVMRILPRLNEAVNEEWISDKTRFIWDGLQHASASTGPMCAQTAGCEPATWGEAFAAIAAKVKATEPERIGAIAGDLAAVEEMFALKRPDGRARRRPTSIAARTARKLDPALGRAQLPLQPDHRRHRAGRRDPDRRLQSAPRSGGAQRPHPQALAAAATFTIGADRRAGRSDLSATTISAPARRRSPTSRRASTPSRKMLAEAKRPMVIVGQGALARPDGAAMLALAAQDRRPRRRRATTAGTALRCCTRRRARRRPRSRLRAGRGRPRHVGMVAAAAAGELDVLFLLGADEIDMNALGERLRRLSSARHGDAGAHRADVILPGAAYTEKSGTYVNTEGRVQLADARRLPAGRCARGLGDPARAVRRARPQAAVRLAGRAARARSTPRIRISRAIDADRAGTLDEVVGARRRGAASVGSEPFAQRRSPISI